MSITFRDFFERLTNVTDIQSQMDLARALGLNRSAITQAKNRDAVPQKWVLTLARRYTLSPDWLEFGTGAPRSTEQVAGTKEKNGTRPGINGTVMPFPVKKETAALFQPEGMEPGEQDTVLIPKAAARLCAGGGSFEVDAAPVAYYSMPKNLLTGMGKTTDMVFMDVVGDSMEPGILGGDMVLVDRGRTTLTGPGAIMAVSHEDAVYLKRVEKKAGGLVLHSDNPAYGPMMLSGDELGSFHVIGKMIWLCRKYW